MLQLTDVSIRFGGVQALDALSLVVEPRTIVGLIGPNGAGKTTVFNCITRVYQPDRGSITFNGRDVLRLAAHHLTAAGLNRTFQNLALFARQSVLDNVLLGGHGNSHYGLVAAGLRLPAFRREERALRTRAQHMLDLVGLAGMGAEAVTSLPFGLQKRVDLARALMCAPQLLLLDEPAAGLNQPELAILGTLLRQIRDELHTAILLVEHHLSLVMDTCQQVAVLDFGRKIAEGTPAEVRHDPRVMEAYLGQTEATPTEAPEAPSVAASPSRGSPRGHAVEVRDLTVRYGPVLALDGVSLRAGAGRIVAILGANGAGKTTFLRAVSGVVPADRGAIALNGHEVIRATADHMARQGVAHVPEGRGIIAELSVLENLRLGAMTVRGGSGEGATLARVLDGIPVLESRLRRPAGSLSGGEQQQLAIGRALMADPRLLLLDEPSLGLAPRLVRDIVAIVQRINADQGVTVLLVEQDASLALELASYAYVFETGRLVLEGSSAALKRDETFRGRYFGV